MSTNPPADWYPDPEDDELERWWDGYAWTDAVRAAYETDEGYESVGGYSSAGYEDAAGDGYVPGSKKVVAGVLAILLGGLGAHKFYLGYKGTGVLQLVISVVTCGLGAFIGVIEGIVYLTKSDDAFVATYQEGRKNWF